MSNIFACLEKLHRPDLLLAERLASLSIMGAPRTEKHPVHHSTIILRSSRDALNWTPIIPGDVILSDSYARLTAVVFPEVWDRL